MRKIRAQFPEKLSFLNSPARYKIAYGGRGGCKSWSCARAIVIQSGQKKLKVLCAREYQNSIRDSVHALIKHQIDALGASKYFTVLQNEIRSACGSEIIFRGISNNPEEIKSLEGVDICWVEEAQKVSNTSWEILIPTIRKAGSEIWVTFNPRYESDPTYQRMVKNPPPGAVVCKIGWQDNPWLSREMIAEKDFLKATDPDAYEYVWEGAFEMIRQGAYYHALLLDAEKAGRITSVPYDPAVPVQTSWDIGVDDETAIWFWQAFPGGELHVIDYVYGNDVGIDSYLGELSARPYRYDTDYVPHDFAGRSFAAGARSAADIARGHGRKLNIGKPRDPLERITALRAILPRCWFDRNKCDKGLEALRAYRRKYDEDRQTYKNTPEHDWSSHSADSAGEFAVEFQERRDAARPHRPAAPHLSDRSGAWMGL